MRRLLICFSVVGLLGVVGSGAVHGSSRQARRHVQRGIEQFRQGEYKAAAKSFAEADVALPEDPRVAFNQACALAAQGDAEKATELFQTAALARDTQLAADAHYNHGCLLASQARAVFGENPAEASPETRQQGLPPIMQAIGHYRDCLQLDEDHEKARRNLELLRLWVKHMQDVWAKRDREQQREEMGLLEFLQMIQAQQQQIRGAVRQQADLEDSPKRRQAMRQTEQAQRQLIDEIKPLKAKITEALHPASSGGGSSQTNPNAPLPPDADAAQLQSAREALTGLADQAGKLMLEAADGIAGQTLEEAAERQYEALNRLNDIYLAAAPFSQLLAKATGRQQQLVDVTDRIVERSAADDAEPDCGALTNEQNAAGDGESGDCTLEDEGRLAGDQDYSELARQQTRVSQWSQLLRPKAEQERTRLESMGQPPGAGASPGPQQSQPPQVTAGQPSADQMEALRKALEKAIELGPAIHDLTEEASDRLADERPQVALPKQEKALKLLQEIAESMPRQPESQGQQDDRQQPGDQNDDQQRPQNQQDEQPQQPPQRDLSRQQAEAVLRKVRQRERKHDELQEKLRRQAQGPVILNRDW